VGYAFLNMKRLLMMSIAVTVLLTATLCLVAQPSSSVTKVRLSGIVRDSSGRPLAGVTINHAGVFPPPVTDDRGVFEVRTSAAAVVFRKRGFSGRYIQTREVNGMLNIVLDTARQIAGCEASRRCLTLRGFGGSFCILPTNGMKAYKQENDIDYAQRRFEIRTASGRHYLRHTAGPLWRGSQPSDDAVWSSMEYQEFGYVDTRGFEVIDARGRTSNGRAWRWLGRAFELAAYSDLPAGETQTLDSVLDEICLRPEPGR
jgi:hypothetical protein